MTVRLLDAEPNGLAEMLAGLLEANLARHPARSRLLHGGAVQIVAEDAGVSAVLRLVGGRAGVENAPEVGSAALCVGASSADLLELSAAPLRLGLPDPLDPVGRAVLSKVLRGRIRVRGILTHPVLLSRLARLLSVR